jgi:hypothetical protein
MNTLRKIQLIGLPGAISVGQNMSANANPSPAGQLPGVTLSTVRIGIGERTAPELQSRLAQALAGPRAARPVRMVSRVRRESISRGKIRPLNFDDASPKVAPAIRAPLEQSKEISMKHYEPSIPRVALGIATVAMTVITIAVSLILPAQMDSGSRELPTLAASKATALASMDPAPVIRVDVVAAREPGPSSVTRIDVVAAREPRSSIVPVRIGAAEPQLGRLAKTTSPAVIRVSSD